ncbi:hypothetical protein E2C01_094818 [Portunus trituberculatus]|uniref:Uncharacterized protein n=1 Tax=Portunus trituberculatus TaxID=210409 RepID=A0A5B7JXX4_PORTR|nr:hypothetical protein [Portunus trituberculatus]
MMKGQRCVRCRGRAARRTSPSCKLTRGSHVTSLTHEQIASLRDALGPEEARFMRGTSRNSSSSTATITTSTSSSFESSHSYMLSLQLYQKGRKYSIMVRRAGRGLSSIEENV